MGVCYLCRFILQRRGSAPKAPTPPDSQQPAPPQEPSAGRRHVSTSIPGSKQSIPYELPTPRKWSPSQKRVLVLLCGNCGKMNNTAQTVCWHCKADLAGAAQHTHTFKTNTHCAVCAFWQYPEDPISLTPCCQAQGHTAHLIDFVRTKYACPSCNQKLIQTQLLHVFRSDKTLRAPIDFRFKVLVCSKCKQWNNPREETCWKCHTSLVTAKAQTHATTSITSCVVCGYGVTTDEVAAICPKCHATGHHTHMHEYVRAKGSCPICKLRMRPTQLLITL